MRLATAFAAGFLAFTGAVWVLIFMALFFGAIILEKAFVCFLKRGGTS